VKLRRSDILFARVNDELARYRIADGKTPFLNIDEEQCLRSKLQVRNEEEPLMFFRKKNAHVSFFNTKQASFLRKTKD
jgi:hypothetical protein